MYKFNFITSSRDEKVTAAVTGDLVGMRISNRTIGIVSIAESGTGFSFGLSDGAKIRFVLKPDRAEVIYYTPDN